MSTKNKVLNFINGKRINIILIILGTIISLISGMNYSAKMPPSANMGALLPLISAPILGLFVLISYLYLEKS